MYTTAIPNLRRRILSSSSRAAQGRFLAGIQNGKQTPRTSSKFWGILAALMRNCCPDQLAMPGPRWEHGVCKAAERIFMSPFSGATTCGWMRCETLQRSLQKRPELHDLDEGGKASAQQQKPWECRLRLNLDQHEAWALQGRGRLGPTR